jgi:uncharacterized protein (DUF111 family)
MLLVLKDAVTALSRPTVTKDNRPKNPLRVVCHERTV